MGNYLRDAKLIDKINNQYNLEGEKMVLFTGRLTQHKGVGYLIKAAKQIDGTVIIIGDGPERDALKQEIAKRNLNNVIMTGYINHKEPLYHAFYERADVYVSPSTWDEPFGLTIIEAMAAKTPVVATNKGGIKSIIKDKSNGYLIPARNASAIAKQVNMLLASDAKREKIGAAAYKTALEKFNWARIARKFEKQYEITLGKKKTLIQKLPVESFFNWIFAKRND